MGVWLGVSAMLAFNVYRNFGAVDSVLTSPPEQADKVLKVLGPENARMLLRYAAGVENGNTFEVWENLQIGLGVLVAMVLFSSSSMRLLSMVPLLMVALVVFLHWKITPELEWLGRSIEFKPLEEALPAGHFWTLHRIYAILDTVKCLLGVALTVLLVAQGGTKVVRRRHHHHDEARVAQAS